MCLRYYKYWVGDEGRSYRNQFIVRAEDLINPSMTLLRWSINKHNPETVLEIGCGYGRLLHELIGEPYQIEGLDVSMEVLAACPKELRTYMWDIAEAPAPKKYDVVFMRGVLVYFYADPEVLAQTLRNLRDSCTKAVVIWEQPIILDMIGTHDRVYLYPIEPGTHLPVLM